MSVGKSTYGSQADDSLYELRRAVFILAEQIGQIRAEKQLQVKEEVKPPLSHRFADQVALMGVTDAIRAKKTAVKIVWIIVFLVALAITAVLVYRVVDEYRRNPTATKVLILRNDTYPYPPIVLCLDTWFNLGAALGMGFSKRGVEYALSYLLRYEDVDQGFSECENVTAAKEEFFDTYNQMNYSSLLDFYKDIALDTMSVKGDVFNASVVTFDCKGCFPGTRKLEKVVVDRGVCYQIPLLAETGKLRGSDGMWRLSIQVPDLTGGLVKPKPYWRLYINTQLGQIQPTAMFQSIDKTTTTAITISGQRFQMVSTSQDPCIKRTESDWQDSAALRCATKCLSEDTRRRVGCRLLSLETDNFTRRPNEYCNRCSSTKPLAESLDGDDPRFQTCLAYCPHECETWTYDGIVDSHASSSIQATVDKANKDSQVRFEAAKIYLMNGAVLRGGILTFTEVFTYSLETLIGTIGGTCGIWISVGVLTLVQVLVFCAQSITTRGYRYIKSSLKKRATTSPYTLPSSASVNQIQTSRI